MNLSFEVPGLMAAPGSDLHLAKIVNRIVDGWHVWSAPDPVDPEFSAFFSNFSVYLELVVKSYSDAQKYPQANPMRELKVTSQAGVATGAAIKVLPLGQAASALDTPLRLVVENEVNDGDFFRACLKVVSPELASMFDMPSPPVEFYNGGGSTVTQVIEQRGKAAATRGALLRMMAIIDSDSKFPGHVSSVAANVRATCGAYGLAVVVLRKRAIENYASNDVLEDYKSQRPESSDAVEFFLNLSDGVRDYYPMKSGPKVKADTIELPDGPERNLYVGIKFPDPVPTLKKLAHFMLNETSVSFTKNRLEQRGALNEMTSLAAAIYGEL